jgi:hypothetical protein
MANKSWQLVRGRLECRGVPPGDPACHSARFLPPLDLDDEELIRLTNQVDEIISRHLTSPSGLTLRILADTETGEDSDRLRFAFVEMV